MILKNGNSFQIPISDQNLNHAMLIVDRLEQCGYTYTIKSPTEVHFNDISGTGRTLAQAITVELSILLNVTQIKITLKIGMHSANNRH